MFHIVPMKKKPDNTSSSASPKPRITGSTIATVTMFLIVVFLWRDQSHIKEDMLTVTKQNEQLKEKLSAANKELDDLNSGDPTAATRKTTEKVAPMVVKPADEAETLFLQTPSLTQSDSGLTARFGFKADPGTPLPELVTLVIRVPESADAVIRSFKPAAESSYDNVEYVVNSKGTLGMIEGTPASLEALEFELTVSAPLKALVRGSDGIKPFELDISAEGCSSRQL